MAIEISLPDHWLAFGIITAAILFACVLYSILHSLRYVRTSQAVVAWTVGLLTLPFIALPLYWIFARHRFEGYREAIREVTMRYQHTTDTLQQTLRTASFARSTSQQSALEQVADVLDTPLSRADHCELLIDGTAFFHSLFQAIEAAKCYIYIEFYIIRDDELGNALANKLIERVADGICVRIVYDEVGCLGLSKAYLARLRDAGVDIRAFNTRQGWVNRFQINFRNHRKLCVVDGNTAIVGGLNVGDEYIGSPEQEERWRDTGLRVTGPIARKVQAVFMGDYYWAARKNLPEAERSIYEEASKTHNSESSPSFNAACCATGPADLRPRTTMMFSALAAAAKSRLWICTPYLVPDEAAIVALHMARSRGVDVRLLIPNKADHLGVFLAGFHYEREFEEAKIPVFRYTDGFMHQKSVLVDDALALIGSTNLDNRSLHLNFELMLAIDEPAFVAEVAAMMQDDFEHASCLEAEPPRWWFERAGTAVARLFSPIL